LKQDIGGDDPRAFTFTGPVPEAFQVLPSDWPEKYFSQGRILCHEDWLFLGLGG